MENLTKQEILNLIAEKNLKMVKVADVIQSGYTSSYKYIIESEEQLKKDIKLYGLHVKSEEYMLLNDEEIEHVNKHGYLKC